MEIDACTREWWEVARALGKRQGETLADAAERVLASGFGRVDVAELLARADGDPWERIARAADLAESPLAASSRRADKLRITINLSTEAALMFIEAVRRMGFVQLQQLARGNDEAGAMAQAFAELQRELKRLELL